MLPLPLTLPTPAAYLAVETESLGVFSSPFDQSNRFAPIAVALASPPEQTPDLVPLALGQTDQSGQIEHLLQFDFSNLPSFTRVQQQYQTWGIELDAISIQPSNPVFLNLTQIERSGGLMPNSEQQPLTLQFHQQRRWVSLTLVTARQIMVRAYDTANRLVAEYQVGEAYRMLKSRSSQGTAPVTCHQIQIQGEALARIEILSLAPFLLRNLTCG